MALILNIETSTPVCSVALARDGQVLALRETAIEKSHAEKISLFINQVLDEAQTDSPALDAVAVSRGPGSYTGLRIGASTAKGLCYGSGIPLMAISSLQAMAMHVARQTDKKKEALFRPLTDARRMEVYTALYDSTGKEMEPTTARVVDENSFRSELDKGPVYFMGNGAAKCREAVSHPNAVFIDGIETSAAYMAPLAEAAWQRKAFEDTAYFTPYYLKDFKAIKPRKNLLEGDHLK